MNWDQIWAIRKSGNPDPGKPSQVLSIWVSRWQRVETEYQSSRTNQSQSSQLADWRMYTMPVWCTHQRYGSGMFLKSLNKVNFTYVQANMGINTMIKKQWGISENYKSSTESWRAIKFRGIWLVISKMCTFLRGLDGTWVSLNCLTKRFKEPQVASSDEKGNENSSFSCLMTTFKSENDFFNLSVLFFFSLSLLFITFLEQLGL